jgi:tRNA wybutosine-synthesizing protein 3
MTAFELQKKATLAKLGKPDKSRATTADSHIILLLDTINGHPNMYTTSSCSGRIMVIEKKERMMKKDVIWHYISHDPVSPADIVQVAKKGRKDMVWFKFEPLILHVCCRDTNSAQALLTLAGKAGLKHSGAITLGKRIIIEIRGNDRIDAPIAKGPLPLVTDDYLATLTTLANIKLKENLKRISLLKKGIVGIPQSIAV